MAGYLTATLADVEWEDSPPYGDTVPCPQDSDNCSGPLNEGYWYRDPAHQYENTQVIKAFMIAVCGAGYCENGAYTSTSNWTDITGFAAPQAIDDAQYIQIASWNPPLDGPQSLSAQEEQVTTRAFTIYSWQYATDACQMAFADADSGAQDASPPIGRFDRWTNSGVNVVC